MMKLYPAWFVFSFTNITGLTMIISSPNWLTMWIGFELSLLGFLPMFIMNKSSIDSMVKYLLLQSGGSALMLASMIINSAIQSENMFLLSILLKIGLFPFFQWVPTIMTTLTWFGCFMIATIQKMGPMIMLLKKNNNSFMLLLISSTLSILISGMMGLNQTNLRTLLGYSSISHTAWMATSLVKSSKLMTTYLVYYLLISMMLFFFLNKKNLNKINIYYSNNDPNLPKIIVMLMILAGLPPFSMFFLKLAILTQISCYSLITSMLILGTALSSYYYLTFIITNLIKSNSKKNLLWQGSMILAMSHSPLLMIL
uniref:NADH-ubiquinone oxidoreductase chain 2 n=1 Tax=Bugula neritina TaxID=10212 RepID=A9UKA0_BUGNE|nr:NADH dehydrogenase subunit 2 [Bugula neritina]AAT79559.1 NADH dehydrogenase subunit 2 [Bugula neritina]